jgi:hypothetical protein
MVDWNVVPQVESPTAHPRFCDRIDRVANKVEHDLLELGTISAKRWKVMDSPQSSCAA